MSFDRSILNSEDGTKDTLHIKMASGISNIFLVNKTLIVIVWYIIITL